MPEAADDATVQAAVVAAIAAAGNAGDAGVGWRNRVLSLVPACTAMIMDGSRHFELAKATAEAHHFRGVVHKLEMEETSKRAILHIANDKGEIEHVRTNPSYTPHGASIIRQLEKLTPGTEILMWKAVEPMRDRPDRKVRVLVHFEVLRTPENAGAKADPPSAAQPGSGTAPVEPPQLDEAPPEPTSAIEAIRANLAALSVEDRKKVVEAFRKKGWQNADSIPPDKHERALYMTLHLGEEPF